jgi:hypothetical protein
MNVVLVAIALLGFAAADGVPAADFSGTWRQDNEHSSPKRSGDVTLKIQQSDSELVVETTSKGLVARHALQRYTTDGVESASTGADGDEFHSKVVRKDATLVFDILEIEDGKRLKSSEIWSLTDGGNSLTRVRQTEKSGDQVLLYTRIK